jgi:FlaA1/EpsC-like NDP-sugar epimerase
MKFIKSTDHMKNLLILSEVEKGLPMTQAILAEIAGVSVAMINSYIKKLCANGYLAMQGNNKNTIYQITPEGIEYKRYLLISFMAELMELSKSMSAQIKQMLLPLVEDGEKKVYFYGAGETGQVCARVASGIQKLQIIGFIDDNPSLHMKLVAGYPVMSLETALQHPFDKIVISVFSNHQLKEKLLSLIGEEKIVVLSKLDTKIWRG